MFSVFTVVWNSWLKSYFYDPRIYEKHFLLIRKGRRGIERRRKKWRKYAHDVSVNETHGNIIAIDKYNVLRIACRVW